MAIYRYPHESLVDSVQILTNEKGGLRAYLYADNGADSEKLRILKQALRSRGYECVPTLSDDRPVLEVRGFKKADELVGYLHEMRALTGTPEVTAEPGDVRTRKQIRDSSTLKIAGISYNIGDLAYMIYSAGPVLAKVRKGKKIDGFDILDIASGIGYGLGSYCLTFFGSKDQSINTITAATSKIERFARKEGYAIAPESSIAFVNEKKDLGTWGNIKHLIGRYPTESLNSIYVGVGACITAAAFHRGTAEITKMMTTVEGEKKITKIIEDGVKAAIAKGKPLKGGKLVELKEYAHELVAKEFHEAEEIILKGGRVSESKAATMLEVGDKSKEQLVATKFAEDKYKNDLRERSWDRMDIGLGVVTAASAITGLAVKEKKHMEGDKKRHGIGGAVEWIREKPLRATGYGYMLATLFHAAATFGKWKARGVNGKGTGYLAGRAVFIATNLLSERLMAISSKGHGEGVKPDSSVDESILSTAAELVLRQPADKREAIISQLSGYIASPEVLAVKADKIEASIRHHIAKLDQNPWTKHYVPTATGEMVEAAPLTATVTKQASANTILPSQSASPTPLNVITNPEYLAKQQVAAHAIG